MFLNNKYTKWYTTIITNAVHREPLLEYIERHHILPKSLGGSNHKNNIVELTAKEHFVCHLLLTKMVIGVQRRSMVFAARNMLYGNTFQQRVRITGKIYEIIKRDAALEISTMNSGKAAWNKGLPGNFTGMKHSSETRKLMSLSQAGLSKPRTVPTSDITRERISITKTDKTRAPFSEEWKKNISIGTSGDKNHNFGKEFSIETRLKQSISAKNRLPIICQCGKSVSPLNYKRWHGDNCRNKIKDNNENIDRNESGL